MIEPFAGKVFGELDLLALGTALRNSSEALKDNDLSQCEEMLFSQANALQAIFTGLARKAIAQDQLASYEVHMRLALRAQAQSRSTLETLAAMKNPAAPTFVKQANIAHGPQQVNNASVDGAAYARAHEKSAIEQNELMKVTHEKSQRLDTRSTQSTIGAHPTVEAVAAKHRTQNSSR